MDYKPVESSQIAEVGYDAETETLGIKFQPTRKQKDAGQPGSEYHYSSVEPDTHVALVTAESVGKYFGQFIKANPSQYLYKKIEPGA